MLDPDLKIEEEESEVMRKSYVPYPGTRFLPKSESEHQRTHLFQC